MPDLLRQRLRDVRHAGFIGREPELALFRDVLASDALPVHLVMVHGPGGIGKTSLLEEVRRMAVASGAVVGRVDGRDVPPTPEAFQGAVEHEFADAPDGTRRVLLVDTYEILSELDDWLRRRFFPTLATDTLVVLAGRGAPSVGWRTDPGWRSALAVLPLRNLSPEEGEAFLNGLGVESGVREAALRFTHGHPLALALVADHSRQRPGRAFVPADAPDVVGALLKRFVEDEPDPAHRAALEAAAVVRATTEPLLAAVLGTEGARVAFEWLRTLHFIEEGREGLWPHDLAREVIAADLRWRDSQRHDTLHRAARQVYTGRLLHSASGEPIHQTLADYAFLYRHNPIVRPFFAQLQGAWRKAAHRASTTLREADRQRLLAMTRQHEGEASEAALAHWLDRQPEGVEVFRDEDGHPLGYLLTLALDAIDAADREADPGVGAARDAVGTLREGERAILFRHWMDAEQHQGVSAVQSLVFAATVRAYLTTPGLVVSFLATVEDELWGPVLGFAGLQPAPEAAFQVGERPSAVFVHDWRAEPPDVWLAALAERTPEASAPPLAARPAPLVVLSRDAFEEAVRELLRDYAQPHNLRVSPLLRSRLVREAAPGAVEAEQIAALRGLVRTVADGLEQAPRELPYYRALHAAYLEPAPTQMMASERIDVPFSTFRRHLGRAVDHVIEELWRRETAA